MNGIGFTALGNIGGVQNRPAVKNTPAAVVETPLQPQGESFQFQGGGLLQNPVPLPVEVPVEKTPTPGVDSTQAKTGTAPSNPTEFKYQGSTIQTTSTGALVQLDSGLSSVGLENEHPEFQAMAWGMDMGFLESTRSIGPKDLNFDNAAPVISGAKKFILPAPKFEGGGEPLVSPETGKPITDYEGKPIGDNGVVFYNPKDKSLEGVTGDGNGVVIMNQLSDDQAKAIMGKVDEFGGDPNKLTLGQFKEVLQFAADKAGVNDLYHSDRDFIKGKMNALESSETGIPQYGLYRRDDRDVCQVLFIEGKGEFTGTATQSQKFDDGAVILKQANKKTEGGFDYRLIQPETFKETYSNKDGSPIDLSRLPKG